MAAPSPGDELYEPSTGSTLRFLSTAAEGHVQMELAAPSGWNAGPLHVHPHCVERLTVLEGEVVAHLGRRWLAATTGGIVVVPRGTPHTVAALTPVRLLVEFEPPLRTDRLFHVMYGGTGRKPPRTLPTALRAWLESRGFGDEIRYLWPRRVALGVLALGLLATTRAASTAGARRPPPRRGRSAALRR